MSEIETATDVNLERLESGTSRLLEKSDAYQAGGNVPAQVPALSITHSAPLPIRSEFDIPARARCSTSPELQRHGNKFSRNQNLFSTIRWATTLYKESAPLLRKNTNTSLTPVPVFLCAICLENHDLECSYHAEACTVQHSFCRESLEMYLTSQINAGVVMSLKCPCYGTDDCKATFARDEVKSFVDPICFDKYVRLIEIKSNPNARECPSCYSISVSGSENCPEITCADCGTIYCFFHNNAHPDTSCEAYARLTARSEMLSQLTIKATSRKCPKCNVPTQKISGCNHMTCQNCGEDWCWLCGRHMDDEHYGGLSPCAGQQFTTSSPIALWSIIPCLRWDCTHKIRKVYHLLLIGILLSLFCAICVASLPVSLLFLPITVPLVFARDFDKSCILFPSLGCAGLGVFLLLVALNIAYLPVPILITLFRFLFKCVTNPKSLFSVWSNPLDNDSDDDYEDELALWLYPFCVVASFVTQFDDCND